MLPELNKEGTGPYTGGPIPFAASRTASCTVDRVKELVRHTLASRGHAQFIGVSVDNVILRFHDGPRAGQAVVTMDDLQQDVLYDASTPTA